MGVALAVLSLAVVLYPFVASRRNSRHPQRGDGQLESQGPQADLEEIYAAIETLRLEHQLGNIPQALYQEQLLGYRLEAAQALRRNSQAESSDPDFLLEQEILAARSALQDPDESGAGSTENRHNG